MQFKAVFEQKLSDFIADNQLFTTDDPLLLAVSGGVDSVVMSAALCRLGYAVTLAHVNYQLRGSESDGDEQFVRQLAENLNVKLFVQRFDTQQEAKDNKQGIQETARKLRYEWFEALQRQYGFTHILTAHHLGDALETSLYQLAKGCGIKGIRGIPLRQGAVVRPMLTFSREEIVQYAHATHLQWREDSSNTSDYYTRNFIRHQIVPLLEKINPSVVQGFADTYQRLSDAAWWLQLAIADAEKQVVHESDGIFYLNIKTLEQLPSPRLFLYEYLKKWGFNYETAVLITKHLHSQSGTQFLSKTHRAAINRGQIVISPFNSEKVSDSSVSIPNFGTYRFDNQKVISIHLKQPKDVALHSGTPAVVWVDAAALVFPLTIRYWQAGDKMQPLGMCGSKKISDILTDLKIALHEKKSARVLCNAQGQILWLIGYRLSEIARISDDTAVVAEIAIR